MTTTAPITPSSAQKIAERVLAKAAEAAAAPAAEAQALRTEALTGSALAVANAASRLGPPGHPTPAPLKRTKRPRCSRCRAARPCRG